MPRLLFSMPRLLFSFDCFVNFLRLSFLLGIFLTILERPDCKADGVLPPIGFNFRSRHELGAGLLDLIGGRLIGCSSADGGEGLAKSIISTWAAAAGAAVINFGLGVLDFRFTSGWGSVSSNVIVIGSSRNDVCLAGFFITSGVQTRGFGRFLVLFEVDGTGVDIFDSFSILMPAINDSSTISIVKMIQDRYFGIWNFNRRRDRVVSRISCLSLSNLFFKNLFCFENAEYSRDKAIVVIWRYYISRVPISKQIMSPLYFESHSFDGKKPKTSF
jgi:hypothetical protein